MKMSRASFPVRSAPILAALAVSLFTAAAEEPSWGVRNAYASDAAPFLKHSENGLVTTNQPGRAGAGDELHIEVVNFDQWRVNQDSKLTNRNLVLFLDRKPIPGLYLQRFPRIDWIEYQVVDRKPLTNRITYFGVQLEQTHENRAVWKKLVQSPGFEFVRPVEVSLGFEGVDQRMNSWVYPAAIGPELSPFNLVILSRQKYNFGLGVIAAAFLAFVLLARKTDLLRDPSLPLRPDGRMQLSLARTQMAFWFFLVFGAFFFLWLMTGYTDTLTSSTITLIGISAGTAVGSAFIDSGKGRPLNGNVAVSRDNPETNQQVLERLRKELATVKQTLSALPANDPQRAAQLEKQDELNQQIQFFEMPIWKIAMQDLLGENRVISFHRFQMVVWTLVLGIVFVRDVYSKAAMPDFDATLLGLMGVSAGTFIGFKLPAASAVQK